MTLNVLYTTSQSANTSAFDLSINNETVTGGGNETLLTNALSAWDTYLNALTYHSASVTTANVIVLEGQYPSPGTTGVEFQEYSITRQGMVIDEDLSAERKQFTYLHELGHVFGLSHLISSPFPTTHLSVMSEFDNTLSGWAMPKTPMVLDLRELQSRNWLSDLNPTDSYSLTGASRTFCIWDTSGTDTLSVASDVTENVVLDLRGGMKADGTDAYWSRFGSEHVSIAEDSRNATGVVNIEKAVGAAGNDSIYGGGISNTELRGNGGDDSIWGDGDKGTGMSFGGDTIYGDAGNDTLYGDNGQNTLPGSSATDGGNDSIYGGSDNDKIYGEGANDTLYGEAGLDTLYGGQGADSISGGNDSDTIYGGLGGDYLYGDDGNDTIYAYDSINGGNDTATNYLYGGAGNDSLVGGAGADIFDGGDGSDTINGGAGNDTFTLAGGDATQNYYNGGEGLDKFSIADEDPSYAYSPEGLIFTEIRDDDNQFQIDMNYTYLSSSAGTYEGKSVVIARSLADTINDPGPDHPGDIMLYSEGDDLRIRFFLPLPDRPGIWGEGGTLVKGVGKDLNYGSDLLDYLIDNGKINVSQFANGDFTVNIGHSVTGTAASDTIRLNANITLAVGAGGADIFIADNQSYSAVVQDFAAGQGDKIDLTAFDGSLTSYASLNVTGSSNAVATLPNGSTITLMGVAASSLSAADFLSNTLYYGTGSVINGSSGNDMLYGTIGNDTIYCNDGNDLATGHMGNDVIYGWTLNDSLWGGYGQDTLAGDDGADQLNGDSGNDSIFGGAGADALYGADGNDTVNGDADNDTVYGGAGNDSAVGGAGADSVFGDSGNDTVGGGTGNDTVYGWTGNDNLFGGGDDDLLLGDAGSDYLAGEAGNDGVYGGDGVDTVVGGAGNDWLEGGLDNDYFTFANGSGNDTINGFDGEGAGAGDIIYLSGVTGFANFAAVQAVTTYDFVNSMATINLGGDNLIYVNGVSQAFTSNDFGFA